jgi:hypothetical protein
VCACVYVCVHMLFLMIFFKKIGSIGYVWVCFDVWCGCVFAGDFARRFFMFSFARCLFSVP